MEKNDCIFCHIVQKRAPCYQIYEDNNFFAFLDIYPRVIGHTLVIPKKHYRWIYEVPNFEKYWVVVLKITKALKKSLNPFFITYLTHGLQVPHAHIHILPRKENETEFVPEIKSLTTSQFKNIAEKIKKGFL